MRGNHVRGLTTRIGWTILGRSLVMFWSCGGLVSLESSQTRQGTKVRATSGEGPLCLTSQLCNHAYSTQRLPSEMHELYR